MIEVSGKYNTAKVFTDTLEEFSREQITTLCDQAFTAGSKIRLMPDVHAGAGCTIGTTMTISDKIVPNLVGVDIGCGMETVIIKADTKEAKSFDPVRLDKIIHDNIPSGMDIRSAEHEFTSKIPFDDIVCPSINLQRARKSIGTLGGGNHFIEANRDDENNLYIVIHSGSRHLGKEVAEYYQKAAWNQLTQNGTAAGIPRDLAYASGKLFDDYINDMKIIQYFAEVNRKAMMSIILDELGIKRKVIDGQFCTIHNYIDTDSMILRKGAVSARLGEKHLIPINMRDGSLVCEGLGNPDWNFSSPHGAGRLMSRTKAAATLKMEDYKKAMEGIYSTSVNKNTIDESPFAYKDMNEIISNIKPTAKILKVIKPVYNYKAAENKKRW
ncbi:MAG: RtcB family protein [Treponema sp.]|nr:RtcB family protein [Treponema sp.]